jgi:cytidyltransferase-like protein
MRIGMITGVFDLFHDGHKNFIKWAAQRCDFLIVMVLSSWMTRLIKGEGRPVDGEEYRRAVVENYMDDEHINGRVKLTDRVDFRAMGEIVDIFVLGEGQQLRWDGAAVVAPRTKGVSTSAMIKERGK